MRVVGRTQYRINLRRYLIRTVDRRATVVTYNGSSGSEWRQMLVAGEKRHKGVVN